MITAFIILSVMTTILFIMVYRKNDRSHIKAVSITRKTIVNLLPLLIMAFMLAGFLQVVVPPAMIQQLLGDQSGIGGVFIGSIAGALIPGGPYIAFPIIASIYQAGAGIGAVVAFISGWALWGVMKVPFEVALVGPKFTVLRYSLVLILPPLAGLAAYVLFR